MPIKVDSVTAAKKIAVITAIDPVVYAQKIGTTIFQNKSWESADIGLDANALVLATIKKGAKRELQLFDGRELKDFPKDQAQEKESAYLGRLCAEWDVDAILLIQTSETGDWMTGTNAQVRGVGLFHREVFGMQKQQVYSVLSLSLYERSSGKMTGRDNPLIPSRELLFGKLAGRQNDHRGRQIMRVDWHDSWSEYTAVEKRVILLGFEALMKDSIASLLAGVGLMDAPVENRTTNPFINKNAVGQSWIPEGNELEIPEGVSRQAAQAAVIGGLEDRGWTVASNSPEGITGTLLDGKKEASVSVTFTERTITLIPSMHQIEPDGQRTTITPHYRWHRNLKESIIERLIKSSVQSPEAVPAA